MRDQPKRLLSALAAVLVLLPEAAISHERGTHSLMAETPPRDLQELLRLDQFAESLEHQTEANKAPVVWAGRVGEDGYCPQTVTGSGYHGTLMVPKTSSRHTRTLKSVFSVLAPKRGSGRPEINPNCRTREQISAQTATGDWNEVKQHK